MKLITLAVVALLVLLTACSGDEPVTTPATSDAVETPEAAAITPATTTTEPEPIEVFMPEVLCLNLQDAQDRIQEAGVFFSRSRDATGEDRAQILDRNWLVVD